MSNKAVFVDRDGTINIDGPYLSDPDKFRMYPGVGEGISKLKKSGYKIIVITNQSGIGRGYFTEKNLLKIHEKMKEEFQHFNTKIDGIYYCPHHPDIYCECRKPKTKLFEKAIHDHDIDVTKSYMVGDKMQDVEAGKKIGVKTILIPTLNNENTGTKKQKPDYIATNFTKAVEWILQSDAIN
jgi:D,D-heptose 1,7-bisphosphate phosphatase